MAVQDTQASTDVSSQQEAIVMKYREVSLDGLQESFECPLTFACDTANAKGWMMQNTLYFYFDYICCAMPIAGSLTMRCDFLSCWKKGKVSQRCCWNGSKT